MFTFHRAEVLTAIGTLGCAIGIGFVMQNSEAAEARYTAEAPSITKAAVVSTALIGTPAKRKTIDIAEPEPLEVQAITLPSAARKSIDLGEPVNLLVKTAASVDDDVAAQTGLPDHQAKTDSVCPIEAYAEQRAAAMVAYTLNAPCLADMPVTIRHDGMTFSEVMSSDGMLELLVPALSEEAWITARFETGVQTDAVAWIDSVPLYDRVVVQWRGETGLQVHAREFGADYGEDGHVWAGAARSFLAVSQGRGGFLNTLGNTSLQKPQRAEVYTFPTAITKSAGAVNLSVEAEVTAGNCGKVIQAQALQFTSGRRVSSQELSLVVPGCQEIGSFLVLNNLLQDLTVASK